MLWIQTLCNHCSRLLKPFKSVRLFVFYTRNDINMDLSTKYALNDGNFIPAFGLGVYKASAGGAGGTVRTVGDALKHGYRLIDTAEAYKNEEEVGQAIKQSIVKREDIYVVTKLDSQLGYDHCLNAFQESLKRLDMDYVDLYMMHRPEPDERTLKTYDGLIALKEKGLVKSIGVSNFDIAMLEGLRKAGKPTPAVNQVEIHPYMRREELVKYCRDHGIHVMGFSPLTRGKRFSEPDVVTMAEKYQKTAAQIFIRWSLQSGFITIPKSSNEKRIIENCQVFDWRISDEDMKILNSQPQESLFGEGSQLYKIHDMKPTWTT